MVIFNQAPMYSTLEILPFNKVIPQQIHVV